MMKTIPIVLLSLFTACVIFSFTRSDVGPSYPVKPPLRTIIVDAGHGGKDPGARGSYSFEKDICLAVALKLGKNLETAFPEVKVLYTRTTDTYPEIRERANFANSNHGDLFVSIHVNLGPKIKHSKFIGYRNQTTYTGRGRKRKKVTKRVPKYSVYYTPNPSNGTETYIWAADRTDEKEKFIAEDVNAEEIVDSTAEYVPDINDPEFKAKALLWTKKFFDKSYLLASMVEESFIGAGRFSRGVKQRNEKGIWVLQATSMPSILVETGFISYKPDEDYLNSEKGQQEIADNVLEAIKKYRVATEGK
jgi:N-acetylmuramoyl-L-alanine amidase